MNADEQTSEVVETPEVPAAGTPEVQTEKPEVPETEAEAKEKAERDEKGRFKGVQPRIDELTRARREAEREAAYWRQMAQAQATPEKAPEKPTPDKFSDYGEYVEALTDWKAAQAAEKVTAKMLSERAQAQQAATAQETWQSRAAEARKQLTDFDEVMSSADVPMRGTVIEALKESDRGPELAYHLAKNPDVAQRLNTMSERQALIELGRLEASLAAPQGKSPPPVKLTQAPKPASVGAPLGSSATTKSPEKMSMDEWIAFRKSSGARWAK